MQPFTNAGSSVSRAMLYCHSTIAMLARPWISIRSTIRSMTAYLERCLYNILGKGFLSYTCSTPQIPIQDALRLQITNFYLAFKIALCGLRYIEYVNIIKYLFRCYRRREPQYCTYIHTHMLMVWEFHLHVVPVQFQGRSYIDV